MKKSFSLLIATFAFIACGFAQTYPDKIVGQIDTVTTFNPETYEETIEIYKYLTDTKTKKVEIVKEAFPKGSKMVTEIDTVIVFDPATKKETMSIIKSTKIIKPEE